MAKLVLTSSVHLDDDVVQTLCERAAEANCDVNEFLIDVLIVWDEICEADLDQDSEKDQHEVDKESCYDWNGKYIGSKSTDKTVKKNISKKGKK